MQHPSSATQPAAARAASGAEEGQGGGEHGRWSSAAAGAHSSAWNEAVRTREIKALPEQESLVRVRVRVGVRVRVRVRFRVRVS